MTGIIIHRSHHAQQYVVIPNALARNGRLSLRARGLLVMLLSLPPEWHVTTDIIAEDNPDSRTAVRAAMRELRDSGYVELVTVRGTDGRTRRHHEVFDTDPANRALPAVGPTCENTASPQVAPTAGKPAVGNAAVDKKYKTSAPRHARTRGAEKVKPQPRAAQCPSCHRTLRSGHVPGCPSYNAMLSPEGDQAMREAIQPVLDNAPSLTPAAAADAIGAAQMAVEAAGHSEAYDSEVRWQLIRIVAAAADSPFLSYETLRAAYMREPEDAT